MSIGNIATEAIRFSDHMRAVHVSDVFPHCYDLLTDNHDSTSRKCLYRAACYTALQGVVSICDSSFLEIMQLRTWRNRFNSTCHEQLMHSHIMLLPNPMHPVYSLVFFLPQTQYNKWPCMPCLSICYQTLTWHSHAAHSRTAFRCSR